MNRLVSNRIRLGFVCGFLWFASACSHRPAAASGSRAVPGRECQEPEALLDVLTQFSNAISHREYQQAVTYLVPEEQAKIIQADGSVSEEMQRKLNALPFPSLANNPKIDLIHGRLKGILDCLPCLDEATAPAAAKREEPKPEPVVGINPAEKDRKAAALGFYRDVMAKNWKAAAQWVDPQEWQVLLDDQGRLKATSKSRLSGIQECDLDALTLKDGRITGVVLLLQSPVSSLWLKSNIFFELLRQDKNEQALSMLVEGEKKYFLDDQGKIRSDRVAKLQAFDRTQWQKLFLSHDQLLGVVDAAIGFENVEPH